ncbi:MAG: cytochrome c oxidase subunit 3 family protein, partial [Calothrix sp. SM1_5_4]|nr:cytochrome c oxidase subunit 3 family protein [Calothrix sp. SM1_5_4]
MSTAKTAADGHHHAHHFQSAEHEYNASKFGTWTFLVTEILMFGGLFVGYIIYHGKYPAMFHAGSTFLDWKLGAFNTV